MEEIISSESIRVEEWLNRLLFIVITIIFFVIVVTSILLVVLRYVFNTGIVGGNELMEFLFVYTTAIGAAVALGQNDHIKIGYFVEKLSPRIQVITDLFGIVCIAFINIVFIVLSYSWISKVGSSESPVMRIPMGFIQISVPVCGILSVIYCGLNGYKVIKRIGKRG